MHGNKNTNSNSSLALVLFVSDHFQKGFLDNVFLEVWMILNAQ